MVNLPVLQQTGLERHYLVLLILSIILLVLRVLDACAGSGALGLEAISRGAHHSTFFDVNKYALEIIKKEYNQSQRRRIN